MPWTGTWRTCLAWGLATLAVSWCFGLFLAPGQFPPNPAAVKLGPILALEFARDTGDLDAIFGATDDPMRAVRVGAMIASNRFDYLFMLCYAAFFVAFFAAAARTLSDRRWLVGGAVAAIAAASDMVEGALLLSINADMTTPAPEIAALPYPVWIKFGLLSVAAGLAGLAMSRQRGWILAIPCLAPLAAFLPAIAAPMKQGHWLMTANALAWLAMLLFAGWQAFGKRRAA